MFMPKAHRVAIYEYLFKEGVLVAEKDFYAAKHGELENIPNLHVIKTMQSLKSRNFVKEQFAWRHYYWYLTNEGIEYLRSYLHLPPEIVPSTLKRAQRSEAPRPRGTSKYNFAIFSIRTCVLIHNMSNFFLQLPQDPTKREVKTVNNTDVLQELTRRLMPELVALMLNSVEDSDVDPDNHHHNKPF